VPVPNGVSLRKLTKKASQVDKNIVRKLID